MKLNLSKPASGYNLAAINDNFTKIEEEFQSKVLYRNNPVGEPNTLESDLDVNGHRLYNVGEISVGGKNISAINSALVWRGTWSSATTYAISDAVYYNGSSYIAVAANTNSAPPSANWNVLAAQGATGAGTGDVVGPASSTTNNIAVYASGTGKLIKDSGITVHTGGAVETFLESSTASAARAAIGAGTGTAMAGANNDITSLTALSAGGLPNSSVLTDDIANGAVTPAKIAQPLTLMTRSTLTGVTSFDFTSIPSWVKRITLMLSDVSTNGTSVVQAQLGSTTVQTTGYSTWTGTSGTNSGPNTTGFYLSLTGSPSDVRSGAIVFTTIGNNTWVAQGVVGTANYPASVTGTVTLAGNLDRLRITTVTGTEPFDNGFANVLFE